MKKNALLICCILLCHAISAQVGINTSNPLGVFHIDPKEDTGGTAASPTGDADDVIILSNGNVGIGKANPSVKLDIKTEGTAAAPVSGFKLLDGAEKLGRILTSDANGVGTWQEPSFSKFKTLDAMVATMTVTLAPQLYFYSGLTIEFPQSGTYLVTLAVAVQQTVTDYSSGAPKIVPIPPNATSSLNGGVGGITGILMQLMPTSSTGNWGSSLASDRFEGSFENASFFQNGFHRLYFSQTLKITGTGKPKAYLLFSPIGGYGTCQLNIYLGKNASRFPQ